MSNLLDKASIVTTPTAYNNGKILSVKPAPGLGSELITNGGFDTDSNWNKQTSNWTIVNGYAVCDGLQTSNSSLFQDLAVVNGKSHRIDFTITNSVNNLNLILGATTIGQYGSGTHSIYVTKDSNASARIFFQATASNNFSGSIDNVSVKQVIDGDFDFTRNSSATRVNSQGLIEDVQILSSNLVSNGGFSQEGSQLVTNGDFATDSNWNKGANWSIEDNKLVGSNADTSTYQGVGIQVNKSYKIQFTVIDYVSGSVRPLLNGLPNVDGTNVSSNGTYTQYLQSNSGSNGNFTIKGVFFNGSVTNVSVKEVGQDWTLGTGWSIGANKAIATDAAFGAQIVDDTTLVANKKYKVTFDISDYVKGNVRVGVGNVFSSEVSSNGSFTFIITSSNTNAFKAQTRAGGSGTTLSISNIKLIEITSDTNLPRINYEGFSYQDSLGSELVVNGDFSNGETNWDFGGDWTLVNGTAEILTSTNSFLIQSNVVDLSVKTYKIQYKVVSTNGSNFRIAGGNSAFGTVNLDSATIGVKTLYLTSNGTKRNLQFNQNAFRGSIDNVSVKEYLGQEVVPDSGRGSWLFEPQSTNLVAYSEDYNTGWFKQNAIISDGGSGLFYLSPTSNVIKYEATGQGFNQMYYQLPSPVTIGNTYTQQGYVKCDDAPYIHFQIQAISSNTFVVWDNINNVVVSAPASVDSYNITSLNGWIKAEITYTATVASIYASIKTYFSTSPTNNQAGIPIGTIAYQTFVQVEALSFATSYIPTNGSTVTRLQDAAFGAGSSDLINSTEGVLYAEIAALANDNIKKGISLSDGTTSNRIILRYGNQSNKIEYIVVGGGAIQANMNISSFNILNYLKIAIKWKLNYFALWINGVEVRTDTIGSTFAVDTLNQLNFDSTTLEPFYGKTKCVAVFEALTDTELECLTTI